MNREIKFRGKRVDNGEWVTGDLIQNPNATGKCLIIERGVTSYSSTNEAIKEYLSESYIEVIPKTVGQFTGLTDKNGKEIYEGDNIKVRRYGSGYIEQSTIFTIEMIQTLTTNLLKIDLENQQLKDKLKKIEEYIRG